MPGYGGYSYYTTCMLDTNAGMQITYNDTYPNLPDGNNVVSLMVNGQPIDFTDATKYYIGLDRELPGGRLVQLQRRRLSRCGRWTRSWHDTQYYVRDAVIDYIKAQTGPISPAIEGRLVFQGGGAAVAAAQPEAIWGLEWIQPEQTTVAADVPDEDAQNVDMTWTPTQW